MEKQKKTFGGIRESVRKGIVSLKRNPSVIPLAMLFLALTLAAAGILLGRRIGTIFKF